MTGNVAFYTLAPSFPLGKIETVDYTEWVKGYAARPKGALGIHF